MFENCPLCLTQNIELLLVRAYKLYDITVTSMLVTDVGDDVLVICVGDNYKMLMTVLANSITNIQIGYYIFLHNVLR